jgi:serine/threonine protein phosphatase PrpC
VPTSCLGGPRSGVDAEVHHLLLTDGDRRLLCTDGSTDLVDDGEIARTLSLHSEPGDACRVLAELALE